MRIHRGYKVYVISSIGFQWTITSFWVGFFLFQLINNCCRICLFLLNTAYNYRLQQLNLAHTEPQIRWFTRQNKFNLMKLMFSLWWKSHFKFVEYLFEIAMMYPMNISIVAYIESDEIWNSYLRNTWWICKVFQSISVTNFNLVSLNVFVQNRFFFCNTTTL